MPSFPVKGSQDWFAWAEALDAEARGDIAEDRLPDRLSDATLRVTLGTELAYAENITGVTTTLATGSLTDIPGTLITIPPSDRPVYVSAALTINGAAIPGTVSNNYLNGAIVEIGGGGLALGFNFPNGSIGAPHTVTSPAFRIGPTVTTRQFKLQAGFGAGGTARNSAASPSFIQAFTR